MARPAGRHARAGRASAPVAARVTPRCPGRIAQPSLSAQIKYLERHVGTRLFLRNSRGFELTRAGALFLADARKSINAADAAIAAARTASHDEAGPRGSASSSVPRSNQPPAF